MLLAAGSAVDIFKKAELTIDVISINKKSCYKEMVSKASEVIEKFQPDAIMVGMSEMGSGLDEALLLASQNIRTYSFQDFWGDTHKVKNLKRHTYFVLDQESLELTKKLDKKSRVLISGSPKHFQYKNLNFDAINKKFKSQTNISQNQKVSIFIGQPLWHLNGYAETICEMACLFFQSYPGGIFFYRAHSRESAKNLKFLNGFNYNGKKVSILNPLIKIEEALLGANYLFSIFSNAAQDYIYLRHFGNMNNMFTYCFYKDDIREYYRKSTNLNYLPLAKSGLVNSIENINSSKNVFRECFDHYKNIKIEIPGQDPSKFIIDTMIADHKVNVKLQN